MVEDILTGDQVRAMNEAIDANPGPPDETLSSLSSLHEALLKPPSFRSVRTLPTARSGRSRDRDATDFYAIRWTLQ